MSMLRCRYAVSKKFYAPYYETDDDIYGEESLYNHDACFRRILRLKRCRQTERNRNCARVKIHINARAVFLRRKKGYL